MGICLFVQEAPYLMPKNQQSSIDLLKQNYTNDMFEGFCVDLLEELARALNFRYKIKPIMTKKYDDMVYEVKTKVGDLMISIRLFLSFVRLGGRFSCCTIDK